MALEDLLNAYLMTGDAGLGSSLEAIPPQMLYGARMGGMPSSIPSRMLFPRGVTSPKPTKAPKAGAGTQAAPTEAAALPQPSDPLSGLPSDVLSDPGVAALMGSPELQMLRAMTPQMQAAPDPRMGEPQGFWERMATQTGGNPIPMPEATPPSAGAGFLAGLLHGLGQGIMAQPLKRAEQRQQDYAAQVAGVNAANAQALAAQQEQRKLVGQAVLDSWSARMKAQNTKTPAAQMVPVDPKAVEGAKAAGLDLTGVLDEKGQAPLPVANYVNKTFGPAKVAGGAGSAGLIQDPAKIHELGEALYAGRIPPTGAGYGMRGAWGQIVADAIGNHPDFNLQNRTRDWKSVERTVASLNGPQQTRLRQAILTAPQALTNLEALVNQFEQVAPQFAALPINRLVNKAGREWGMLGPQAQDLAVRIATQVVDVQPELAQIVMAGGVPGERSLQMAQQMVNANYAPQFIRASIGTTRQNLQYRLNAIQQTLPITPGGGVAGPEAGGPAPAGNAPAPEAKVAAPEPTVNMKAPNGTVRPVPQSQVEHYRKLGAKVVR